MPPCADNEGYASGGSVDASTTVVVVGAGPSGLMLACNLARFGIDVTILDDRPDKTSTGKADGLQPQTIETFKQMRLADPLLRKAVRVYDISFWQSTADKPLQRTGRQMHYPEHLVGASNPYILLAHQGMVEETLIDDMESRGVFIARSSRFVSCSRALSTGQLNIVYEDLLSKTVKTIRADYLVGCDGARSKVREFIPDAQLEGEMTNASWGVLDGVIDTDFPDLWSKVAVRSHVAGSILWIPRERNMTRLYVQLSESDGERVDRSKATPEYVMQRARDAMYPFHLEWKRIEWFGNYVVGQRVAKHFSDSDAKIFIAGDAGHCHSALAAQGANTSMHDSFNLAWKLNLVIRGLAKPSLLATYEEERQKIAYDLIKFDAEHCKAFSQGDAALARNFDDNIRFISGVGAEYSQGMLSRDKHAISTPLQPGALQLPAKVTRYIDANPVDVQLDIPILGQFRIYFFIPDVPIALGFLSIVCERFGNATVMGEISSRASQSYTKRPRRAAPSDEFIQPQRYTPASSAFTFTVVTQSLKSEFEIADLPEVVQDSRWTLYLDNVDTPRCTDRWFGSLQRGQAGIVIVRPDGYVGAVDKWNLAAGNAAGKRIEDYFSFMM
ncbi:Phenol 2-monooxygenase [Talaromyces islandicus]|uniref:Phenol 2-monooxygenase n=1 Tax=Talaromyces islandicus TaxID=28573 RepID=A0A0U1LWZ1_TALIS|nr:Phenol 2-monooxygenase [Talaromyces islandicus]